MEGAQHATITYYCHQPSVSRLETLNIKYFFKKRFYLFIFRDRGREAEREGEKHQCVVASRVPPLGTQPITQARALTRN